MSRRSTDPAGWPTYGRAVRQALIEPMPTAGAGAAMLGRAAPAVAAAVARPLRAMPAQSARQAPSVQAQAAPAGAGQGDRPDAAPGGRERAAPPAAPTRVVPHANAIERAVTSTPQRAAQRGAAIRSPGGPIAPTVATEVAGGVAQPDPSPTPNVLAVIPTPNEPPRASAAPGAAPRATVAVASAAVVAERDAPSDVGLAPSAAPSAATSFATSIPKQAAEVAAGHRIALRRWRSRVHAYVGTHHVHVELRELGRRLDWRTVRTLRQPIGPGPAATLADAVGSLGEALHALRSLGDGAAGEDFGRAACDVVLADAWLVYDVIDIDLATLSPTLAQQAVSAALADIAGLPSESLHVRWQRQRAGRSVFGMAIARDDLDLLQRELAGHGLRLAAVTGEIISVLRAQRSRLPAERAIVAIGRTAGTQLAALSAGEIAAVQFEAGALGPGALPAVAQRVIRARGLEAGASMQYCVDLCAGDMDSIGSHPDAATGAGGSPPGWQWLPAPAWVRPA